MRTIYQKQLYQLGLKNINDFMKVYYPEYFGKKNYEKNEIARCFYGNVPRSNKYNEILTNAMSEVNGNEELLNKRVIQCKQEAMPYSNRRIRALERDQKMKEWFRFQLPRLYKKIEKELGIEVYTPKELALALNKYGFTESQIQKIFSEYYIGEEQIKYLNDIIDNKSLLDDPVENVKVRKSSYSNHTNLYNSKTSKNRMTKELEKDKDEIIKYIKNNYNTYQNFILANEIENMTITMFHNWKSYNKLSAQNAKKISEWWSKVKDNDTCEEPEIIKPEKIQLQMDELEVPCKKISLKTKKILFNEVISGNDINILENFINSILSEKDIQDILFVKEYEFLKLNETNVDTIMLSFIKNSNEYKQKENRYNCISKEIKELASVIETE